MVVVNRGGARRAGPIRRVFNVVRFVPLVMAVMATGGVVGLYFQPPGLQKIMSVLDLEPGAGTSTPIAVAASPAETASPRPALADNIVVGLGRVTPASEVVTIAPPFGAGDARIATLAVGEGDRVEAGVILATFDNERQLAAAVDAARATVAAREALLSSTRLSVTASRAEAAATLARAESAADNARRDLERTEALRQRGFATEATFEQKRAAYDEAMREVDRARATLSRFGGDDVDAQRDVLVAARNLDQSIADLARSTAELEKAVVHAPMAGTVLSIHARPGEKPGAEGILDLADLDRMTVEVEVYHTRIGLVDIGDPVTITADALPGELLGTVDRMGLEVRRQSLVDADPAANTDARVVKVTVALDDASSALARRYTNLQVLARIKVEKTS